MQRKNESDSDKVIIVKTPMATIRRIFDDYVQTGTSADDKIEEDSMVVALGELDSNLTQKDLILIINVWMYYDPTDFTTRKYVEKVLFRNGQASILALDKRIKNKKEWENAQTAPYSELPYLRDKLRHKTQ